MFRFFHQLPFLCGLPFLERRASETAHLLVGRTGKHLFLTDSDDGRRPLLLQMVDDCDDIKFRLFSVCSSFCLHIFFLGHLHIVVELYRNEFIFNVLSISCRKKFKHV
jgi:hypothetical protein